MILSTASRRLRAGVRAQELGDLAGEGGGAGVGRLAGERVEEGGAGAQLGDQRVVRGEERRVLVVPEHHVAVGQHQAGAERVVGVPDLHVGGVGGVADVERVEEQEAAEVARDDAGDQPVEPPAAQPRRGRAARARRPRHSAKASAVGPISTRSLSSGEPSARGGGSGRCGGPSRVRPRASRTAPRAISATANARARGEMLAEEGDAEDRHEDDAELVDGGDPAGVAELQRAEVAEPGGAGGEAGEDQEQEAAAGDRRERLPLSGGGDDGGERPPG